MPIYNVQRYLANAIESILVQSVSKEIILVDDGSTDESLQIAQDYASRYPFVTVLHYANSGVSAARNRGLRVAQGEYVLFLDPDDELDRHINFQELYDYAHPHNIAVVKGLFYRTYPEIGAKYLSNSSLEGVEGKNAKYADLSSFFASSINRFWINQIGCFLIKRQFLQENQICFDEELNYHEDVLFCIRMYCCQGIIVEIPDAFIHYIQHNDSAMANSDNEKRALHHITAVQKIEQLYEKAQGDQKNLLLQALARSIYITIHFAISTLPSNKRSQYIGYLTPFHLELFNSINFHPDEYIPQTIID